MSPSNFSRFIVLSWLVLPYAACNQTASTQDLLDVSGAAGSSILPDRAPPAIISPAASGGGRAINLQATLQWAAKIAATSYTVEVATDIDLKNPIAGSPFKVATPATSLTLTLPEPVRYYWRVRGSYNSKLEYSAGYFDAIQNAIYVYCPGSATLCDDTGQGGSRTNPMRTINGAITVARNNGISEVQIATRDSGAAYNEAILAASGVSLKGSYTAAFTEAARNFSTNQTKVAFSGPVLYAIDLTKTVNIQGFNLVATGAASSIVFVSSATNALILQNNRIETSVNQPGPSYGVFMQNSGTMPANSPLLTNNVILSGNVTTPSSITTAIRLENSSPTIRANYIKSGTIVEGTSGFLSLAAGLANLGSNPLIINNVIIANSITGGNNAWSIGYHHYTGGGGTVSNNTIVTLSALGNAHAVGVNGGAAFPTFTNNIFFNANGGNIYFEWSATDNAISLHNNAFIADSGSVWYRDVGTGNQTWATPLVNLNQTSTTIGAGGSASGNLKIATNTCLPFVNYLGDDYRLQQNGCSANEWRDLRYGARNTSLTNCGAGAATCGGVTDDLNLVTRTPVNTGSSPNTNAAGYSIGAYEQD